MSTVAVTRPAASAGRRIAILPAFAGALSLSAAIAHFGVAEPHWREWWIHGAFFVVCGVAQTLLAALVVWKPRAAPVLLAGIAGNLSIIAMYVYSRTNGSPVGPHAGVPEEPGVLDMVTTGGEVVLVVALVLLLEERARRWGMHLVLLFGVALWTGRATGIVL